MRGVGTPLMLVPPGASPHSYQLRPSDAAALQEAQVVFWVGQELEAFLVEPMRTLAVNAKAVELMKVPGVTLLPTRIGGVWEAEAGEAHEEHGEHGTMDAHLWLDPANAKAIVAAVEATLVVADPDHAAAYAANAKAAAVRLDKLTEEVATILAPVRGKPFIVLHDAYQYLEHAFGLTAVGSITISPDQPPSARRLVGLRQTIRDRGVICVFAEDAVVREHGDNVGPRWWDRGR